MKTIRLKRLHNFPYQILFILTISKQHSKIQIFPAAFLILLCELGYEEEVHTKY